MKKPPQPPNVGIWIGASKEAIAETKSAILAILNVPDAGDVAKAEGLRTLATLCKVENTTITGCDIRMK